MGRVVVVLFLVGCAFSSALAQRAPQNARQALLDMFFGKPGSMERHLPEATRAALREASAGGPSLLQQLSMLTSQMNTAQTHIESFETGSTLIAVEDPRALTKFEAIVEKDDLRGDEDEIGLSFRMYKNGQQEHSPVLPLLTFLMKQEKNVWRLNEISVTVRVPLADPEFLKTIVAGAKARAALAGPLAGSAATSSVNTSTDSWSPTPTVAPNPANESSAVASIRTILTAEVAYANTYPRTGFTCSLSDLDGFGQGTPNEHQAMLIESRLASGKKHGYVFTISSCGTSPNPHFVLTAVPAAQTSGRAFCATESGTIRSSEDGQAASCLSRGIPVQ
jgi:hypothetical protein